MRISDWSSDVCSSDLLDPKGAFVSLVRPAPSFGKIDIAGAKETGRLKTLRHRGARELEREAPPADLRPYQDRFLQLNPPPASPEPGEVLGLDGERGRAADARRHLENGGLDAPALPAPEDQRGPHSGRQRVEEGRRGEVRCGPGGA